MANIYAIIIPADIISCHIPLYSKQLLIYKVRS